MELNYFGTKQVLGTPMTRQEYNDYRGWDLPANENGEDKGFLVEYLDSPNSNHPDHKGYISWSPEGVFNRSYKKSGEMSFGHALEALKSGKKVSRSGWNGKGMFLYLTEGSMISGQARHAVLQEKIDEDPNRTVEILPHIDMYTTNSQGRRAFLCGWLASQTDMLEEDWCILD